MESSEDLLVRSGVCSLGVKGSGVDDEAAQPQGQPEDVWSLGPQVLDQELAVQGLLKQVKGLGGNDCACRFERQLIGIGDRRPLLIAPSRNLAKRQAVNCEVSE